MDMNTTDPIRDALIKKDPSFRSLIQQHQKCEKRLTELGKLNHPNDDEIFEETTLKKKKLLIKDEIHSIMQKQEAFH